MGQGVGREYQGRLNVLAREPRVGIEQIRLACPFGELAQDAGGPRLMAGLPRASRPSPPAPLNARKARVPR